MDYKFSKIIGTNYQNGNIQFSNCDKYLFSPIGNNISVLYLEKDEVRTIQVDSSFNIQQIAINPVAPFLVSIDEKGNFSAVDLTTDVIVKQHFFKGSIHCISFSPNGKFMAVAKDKVVLMYHASEIFKPNEKLVLYQIYVSPFAANSITWTSDSQVFAIGSSAGNVRVFANFRSSRLVCHDLARNPSSVMGNFFLYDSLDLYTVSENGQLWFHKANQPLKFLFNKRKSDVLDEDDGESATKKAKKETLAYKVEQKFIYKDANGKIIPVAITALDFHGKIKRLVTGFNDGTIMIHLLPKFEAQQFIHVCMSPISSINIDKSGRLISLGCRDSCQLDVYCWSSKSYYYRATGSDVRSSAMSCMDYSADGTRLATGDSAGQLRLWVVTSGRCLASFKDHLGPVTGVAMPTKKNNVVFSSSLDGTVRGYDIYNQRCYRTLTTGNRTLQLSCVAVDEQAEFAAAGGGVESFSVFVWDIKTQLLMELVGHEEPVVSLHFSGSMLLSGSWDRSLRLWDFRTRESKIINTEHNVVAVAFRPDGRELAGGTLNGTISIFDTDTLEQRCEIESQMYLSSQTVTSKHAAGEKVLGSVCYSTDGQLIAAAAHNSKFICIYDVNSQILITRYEISCNLSLSGVSDVYNRHKLSQIQLDPTDTAAADKSGTARLRGDGVTSLRSVQIQAGVHDMRFSPDGSQFSVATIGQGIVVFDKTRAVTASKYMIGENVDFGQLTANITAVKTRKLASEGQLVAAMEAALRLRRSDLIQFVLDQVELEHETSLLKKLRVLDNGSGLGLLLARFLLEQPRHQKHKGPFEVELLVRWIRSFMLVWAGSALRTAAGDMETCAVMAKLNAVVRDLKARLTSISQMSSRMDFLENVMEKGL